LNFPETKSEDEVTNKLRTKAYIGIGSNLGDRTENLSNALEFLKKLEGTTIESFSSIYESEPLYNTEQPDYLNMAVMLSTSLTSFMLLDSLLSIENEMGRIRESKYGPRIIDLDILFYGDQTVNSDSLQIPHPLLDERLFVLKPLNEIAGELVCPVRLKSIAELLSLTKDTSQITKYKHAVAIEVI